METGLRFAGISHFLVAGTKFGKIAGRLFQTAGPVDFLEVHPGFHQAPLFERSGKGKKDGGFVRCQSIENSPAGNFPALKEKTPDSFGVPEEGFDAGGVGHQIGPLAGHQIAGSAQPDLADIRADPVDSPDHPGERSGLAFIVEPGEDFEKGAAIGQNGQNRQEKKKNGQLSAGPCPGRKRKRGTLR